MGTTVLKGPFLVTRTGGTATKPPTETVTTTPEWTQTRSHNSFKRVKPPVLRMAQVTTYHRSRSETTRGYAHSSFGNRSLGPVASAMSLPHDVGFAFEQNMQSAFLEKVKGESWNVGTFVGELPETLSFFTGAAKALWQSYKAVKRGNLRKMRKVLSNWYKRNGIKSVWKTFSDVWLTWRMAVAPLVSETSTIINALADTGLRPYLRRVAVNATRTYRDSTKLTQPSPYTHVRMINRTLRYGAYYSVNPLVDKWKQFGALNLLAVLWELTPLSFVVDYFIPVGSAIANLDSEAGVSYTQKWVSSLVIQDHSLSGAKVDRATWYEKSYNRSVNGQSGVTIPWYEPHISVTRYFDLLALVRSVAR